MRRCCPVECENDEEALPLMPQPFPRAGFDSTLALLKEAYDFIPNRCEKLGSDVFETRLMMRPVVCMRGPEAAEIFYDGDRFTRQGAMPPNTVMLLQDFGSVQLLDGAAHRRRKAMFTRLLLDDGQLAMISSAFERHWQAAEERWRAQGSAKLLDEVVVILGRAACDWTGVPCDECGGDEFARELDDMVENAGKIGPGNWMALRRRAGTEKKIRELVERFRSGSLDLAEDAPLRVIAEHRDIQGELLDANEVTVEVLNLLRPIVAVSRFIVYAAIALEKHPEWKERFAEGDGEMLRPFAEEVRRHYPFFPFVGGKVRQEFEWRGRRFEEGEWVLLDLYGTDHHPASFDAPDTFRPERGLSWADQGHAFIPHGAGDTHETHRCPGERFTVELMTIATRNLAGLHYVAAQGSTDLPERQFPPRPANGFLMTQIGD